MHHYFCNMQVKVLLRKAETADTLHIWPYALTARPWYSTDMISRALATAGQMTSIMNGLWLANKTNKKKRQSAASEQLPLGT